ncbi:putative nucleotidyltransferase substrate binding domain-containing protein [Usitatibacter palustris]|uniref:CBS domain-containing protein n=1 Tax=Usitatibacter palustris TaxID=2732487 RepID=A0A6M4HCH8_9PROT|nr:putative nucleotidyltransferase substrate binding domain-containing protein [Usitatibacter palustris]QJR16224.1 hypothetical protein DSM104440_03053 [Usitatibacter palustris]
MSLLDGTIATLKRHAPFDRMQQDDLAFLASHLAVTYYPAGTRILDPTSGNPSHMHIIKQGAVTIGRHDERRSDVVLHAGECFPMGALLARRPVSASYEASHDTFCFLLGEADFRALMERSAVFNKFCTRRIALFLEQALSALKSDATLSTDPRQPLDRRLAQVVSGKPVTCPRGTTLRAALARMHDDGIGSILVTNDDGSLAGIFTLKDLLARVALADNDLEQPIDTVMTPDPISLPGDAFAYEAALEMSEHNIHHVVVKDGETIAGLVSERDLFALQRIGLRQVGAAISQATTIEALVPLSHEIRDTTQELIAQGVEFENLARIVASLHDRLTRRVIEISLAVDGVSPRTFCWLSLGSEGRRERTLASDQDNAIVFPDGTDPKAMRELLLPAADRINHGLDAVGFPLCTGFIMGSNPRWCLSESEWREEFSRWIAGGDPKAILQANIFFDFRPLHGEFTPARRLREWLVASVPGNSRFLRLMAENALANRPPLGLVRDFELSDDPRHPQTIDLKMRGAMIFTDAARIYALAQGVEATNTAERIREVTERGGLPKQDSEAWLRAVHVLQLFRLRHQHALIARGEPPDNHLRPDRLNEIDRRLLKECLRAARTLQQRIALDYDL